MLIDHDKILKQHCRIWADARWLAVDTEFVREQTYYPKLCLMQVSDGREPAVIDMLSIKEPQLLLNLVESRHILKVFHAPSQDLEIFVHWRGQVPQPLFDTQVAAALLGEGDQLGYAALVQRRLGITLDKTLTRTDWSRRPLSRSEILYAAEDVRHLAKIYPLLRQELEACDRLEWLWEECARHNDPEHYTTRPEDAWKRLRGFSRLSEEAQPAAVVLAAWRERQAAASDRPRKWVLSDAALYELAEKRPDSIKDLSKLEAISPRFLDKQGRSLLQALAKAGPQSPLIVNSPPLESSQKRRLQALRDEVEISANRLRVPASLLATRAELERIVRRDATVDKLRLFGGWRRRALPELLDLIDAD